jgi:DNA-binding response OmpR family regulator
VIFLTAKAMRSEVEQLMQSGATGVLTKPFDPMTLASQVRAILSENGH